MALKFKSIHLVVTLPVYLILIFLDPWSTTQLAVGKVIYQNSVMKFMVSDLNGI